jgi:regulator of sirC expression with transglutaminase-like and TPR domain
MGKVDPGSGQQSGLRYDRVAYIGLIEDEDLDPAKAALDLASLDHHVCAYQEAAQILEAVVDSFLAADDQSANLPARVAMLAIVIGGRFGIVGDEDEQSGRRGADLIHVLSNRRGLPVSMAILFTTVARAAGMSAVPLAGHGRVLLRIADSRDCVLMDPFSAGAITRMAPAGAEQTPGPLQLERLGNRSMLARLLINDAIRAEASGDTLRAARLFERLTIVVPENVDGWFGLVRYKLMLNAHPDVRRDLAAILEITRDPGLRLTALRSLGV